MANYKFLNEVWALIPARSGSKRIKNKNLKKINNLSLVARATINCCKSKKIKRIFLSTDSIKISREGKKYGAEVPFLRSKKNSNDKSNDFDVIREFLIKINILEKKIPIHLIYIRPTTPIREIKIINKAIKQFKSLKNYDSLISVHEMNEPVHKKFFIKGKKLKPILKSMTLDQANNPRQDFAKSYTANGYLDIINTKNIIFKKNYLGKSSFPFVTKNSIDIDDKLDLEIVKLLINKNIYVQNYK